MCISTAYKNSVKPENIIMNNVVSVEYINNKIVLTDILDRKMTISGELKLAHLADAYLIINTKE